MVVNEATSCVQAKGTKTVIAAAVATMVAGAMMSAPAFAEGQGEGAENPTPKYDLKVDGIQETNEQGQIYGIKLIGGDYINNGPNGSNAKARYGDHSIVHNANITGDAGLVLGKDVLEQRLKELAVVYQNDEPAYIDVVGGGVVYGSVGMFQTENSANVSGNVKIDISDYSTEGNSGHGALSIKPAIVESGVGQANVGGNVDIILKNVHASDSDIQGGGSINGYKVGTGVPPVNAEAIVNGDITIKVENALLSFIDGGGNAEARPNDGTNSTFVKCDATVKGDVTIDLKNTKLELADYLKEDNERSVLAGGGASENGSVADVLGNVTISLTDKSSVDLMYGGGCTGTDRSEDNYDPQNEPALKAGQSAKVGKNVSITLDNSSVDWMLIAGGITTESFYYNESNKPQYLVDGGDAAVYGNTSVTLRNHASVNDVYMAGYGKGSDVKGDALLTIEDASVNVAGTLHGQGYNSTTRSSTLAFGTKDKAYTGDFKGKFVDFDEVSASDGSKVNLGTINSANRAPSRSEVNQESWLKFAGNGEFKANLDLASQNNVWINSKFQADSVKLDNAQLTICTGTLNAGTIALGENSVITVKDGGTLSTVSGQIFKKALDDKGAGDKVEGLLWDNSIVFKTNSTLTLNDKAYNLDYVGSAYDALKSSAKLKKPTLVFTGQLVNKDGSEATGDVPIDNIHENTVVEKVDIKTDKPAEGTSEVTVNKNVGGQTIEVGAGGKTLAISSNKTLTLVGKVDGGELVVFDQDIKGDKMVTASGSTGGLTLGSTTNETKGKVSATVEISDKATLTAQKGSFTVDAVKASSANIDVKSGELTVKALEVKGATTIAAADDATTKVSKLTFAQKDAIDNKITITGAVAADEIAVDTNASATIAIGTTGTTNRRGELTIGKGSLKGLTFFLDPTWVEGQEVTDASRLMLDNADATYTLDGNVVVGHNSYVVMGTKNDKEFVDLFSNGTLKWGNGEGETLAAAYIAKPVKVTTGALTVNGALTAQPETAATQGSVSFAADSVLVADVSKLDDDAALITAKEFSVDATSKAVVVGLKNGQKFKLAFDTNGGATDFWNTESTLVSGNKLIKLNVGAGGTISAGLINAASVYGNLMQGQTLADAAMASSNAYADALLTDATGTIAAADIAARFDAAMNTAGAAATFTTAYDRASEFRTAVRGEALSAESNRLWAQAIGGKTKLKGISTGAQSLHVDTDAYGLVIGGDADLNGFTVGAAFTAGNGDSENKTVGVKDDFDFYGLSLYGKTTVGGVDILADASATWLKSDLTMGGLGDVDTDTTTAVYSLGVQAQKTFDLGIDVTPFIGVDVYHVRADGYSNGHGASVQDADATAVEFPIGVKMSKAFEANGFKLAPNFTFAVIPTAGNRDIDSKVRFADAESTYNFTFADDIKVSSNLGFTAEKNNFALGLNAGYDWGNEERSATKFTINATYRF